MNQSSPLATPPPQPDSERVPLSQLIAATIAESRAITTPDTAQSSEELLGRALRLISEAHDLLTAQRAKIDTLEILVDKDEMTGLLNRRGLEEHLARELARVRRKQSRGCSLAIFDLDGFKSINDNYGHPAGDAAIRAVGDFFRRTIRDTDMIARLGGDEFALVLTNIDSEKADIRTKAISFALNTLSFKWENEIIALRGSFGLTSCTGTGQEKFEKLYRAADEALYRAKEKQAARNEGKALSEKE